MAPSRHRCSYEAWRQTIHPDDRAAAERAVQEAASNGTDLNAEWRTNDGGGGPRWLMSRGRPTYDDHGQVVKYLGIVMDITDRKEMDLALMASEVRYRRLFESAKDGILILDADTGQIVDVNPFLTELLGYSQEQMLKKMLWEIGLFRDVGNCQAMFAELQSKEYVRYEDLPLQKIGGELLNVEFVSNVYRVNGGKVVQCNIRDITDRKKAEESLRTAHDEVKERLKELNCLYAVSNIADRRDIDLDEILQITVDSIVSGWHYPEVTCAKIVVNGKEFRTENWADAASKQSAEIIVDGKTVGSVEVGYLKAMPEIEEGPFLKEERQLILAIASTVGRIIERTKSERALIDSEKRYRLLADNTLDVIWQMDLNLHFTYVNPAVTRMTGYAVDEWIGSKLPDHCDEENLAKMAKIISEELAKGPNGSGAVFEAVMIKKNGEPFDLEIHGKILFDDDGRPIGVQGVTRDITDRKKWQEELIRSEAQLSNALEMAHLGHWEYDVTGDLFTFNDQFYKIFRTNVEQVGGYSMSSAEYARGFVHPDDMAMVGDEIRKAIETTDPNFTGQLEHRILFADGETGHISVRHFIVKDDRGRTIRTYGVNQDISDRKKAEADRESLREQLLQAQKMEAVGTLAGGVAHDFNNILQVAVGYSELILGEEGLPQKLRADLSKIHESAKRGADLVKRLLTFGRKTQIEPQPLNLNRRIVEMRKMLERTIPKMVDIQLSLGENLFNIYADPTQVDQILMNLAVNARDAMPEGGNLIVETANVMLDDDYVRTHLEAKPGHHVLLMVTDTGSGMENETLKHIFEPFYTTKAVGEGTGLGLAMVHGIVKQHGGHIECYSELGRGTTFKIYLPALDVEEVREQTSIVPLPLGGSEIILVTDDEELIRDLGARILTKAGYRVITASDGGEALQMYQERKSEIALVILDLIMPKMGGKECLEGLLKLDPAVKVVIASGYSATGHAKDAIAAGAKGFVNKPYNIRQMLEVVRKILDSK